MLPQTQEIERLRTEILIYKDQAATNIIEIGHRLIQAKELMPHGEWGKWLEERVDFSQSTAVKFMKVAKEFSNSESVTNLGTKKLFLLLDLPPDEREEFTQQPQQLPSGETKTVQQMSTRELQEAIKARKSAEQEAKKANEQVDDLLTENKRLNKELSKTPEPKTEVEVIPDYIQKRLLQLETQNKGLEGQVKSLLISPEKERMALESKASMFTGRINLFLRDMGGLAYIGQEVISSTSYTRQEYERSLTQLEKWCREMRMSLSELREKPQIIDAEII